MLWAIREVRVLSTDLPGKLDSASIDKTVGCSQHEHDRDRERRHPLPEHPPAGYQWLVGEPPFDPDRHLALEPPAEVATLSELGYPDAEIEPTATPVAVSAPFRVLNDEGIAVMEPRRVSWRPGGKCGLQPRINAWIDRLRGVPSVTACSSREKWLTPSTMTHSASSPADEHIAAMTAARLRPCADRRGSMDRKPLGS